MANDANIIKIKRSGTAGAPSSLKLGELAYSYLTASGNPTSNGGDRLFIGANGVNGGTGNANDVIVIGGKYFTDLLDHARGTLTASSALIVGSDKKLDELLVDNLSLNGNTLSTSDTDGDLLLTPNGSGRVVVTTGKKLKIADLTATRVPYVGTDSVITDTSSFTWDNANQVLKVGAGGTEIGGDTGYGYVKARFVQATSLTSTRLVFSDADNKLVDSSKLTWASDTLTLNGTLTIGSGVNAYSLPTAKTSTNGYVLTAQTDGTTSWAAAASTFSLHAGTGGDNTGSDATINLLTDNLELRGEGAISTALTKTTIGSNDFYVSKIKARLATTSNTGVASFSSDYFSVNITGDVSLKDGGVTNSKLEHSSFYIGTTNITLGDASGHTTSLAVDISGKATTAGTADNVAYELSAGDDIDFDVGSTFDGSADRTLNVTSTLDSVTDRGDTTTNSITVGGLTIGSGPGSYALPSSEGTNGYVLTTNGTGTLTWAQASSSLKLTADSGGPRTVDLINDTVNFVGGTNITSVASAGAGGIEVTFNLDSDLASVNSISSSSNTGDVTLNASGGHSYVFKTDGTVTFNNEYTFPAADGTSGYVLTTDGNGTLSWGQASSSFTVTGTTGSETLNVLTDTFNTVSSDSNISVAVTKSDTTVISTITLASSLTGVSIDGNAGSVTNGVYTTDTSTVTNTMLANSTIEVNGTSFTLGSTGGTITANTTNALANGSNIQTFSFDGSTSGVTVALADNISLTGVYASDAVEATNFYTSNLWLHDSTIESGTTTGSVDIVVSDGATEKTWTFETNGNLEAPTNGRITGLHDPIDAQDAATKHYVDAVAQGLHVHAPALVATTNTLATISGGSVTYNNGTDGVGAYITLAVAIITIDGIGYATDYLQDGSRVLVKDEDKVGGLGATANGIYTINASGTVLTRATDFDTPPDVHGGDFVFVQYGTTQKATGWVQTQDTDTIGVSNIDFQQFAGAGTYLDGDGLLLTGNVFSVKVNDTTGGVELYNDKIQLKSAVAGAGLTYTDGVITVGGTTDRITVSADAIDISTSYAGQTSITTLGTIATGTWSATTIASNKGGTGFTTYAKGDILYASAANTLSKLTAGTNGQMLQLQDGVPVWADLDGGTYGP
jgi:hypothetical protein